MIPLDVGSSSLLPIKQANWIMYEKMAGKVMQF